MKRTLLFLALVLAPSAGGAQALRDDFNRPATTDLADSERWRRVLDLTHPSASMQINADSTISPYNPLGTLRRGAVYWDSALTGRFQVGIILRHKSGGNNHPVFHIHLMNDSSWYTGDGYGLRFQENSGTDRYDIQRLTGSGADTPFVSLLATLNTEFAEGDTLMFKCYENGRKTAVRYAASGARDSISVVDTVHNPPSWYAWIQAVVFADSVKLDNFFIGTIPYLISASAGPGGSISPAGGVPVDPGADTSFTIAPDVGFGIDDVLVDSVSVGATNSYAFTGVTADHTIEAIFDTLRYTITATAGPNGAITPAGPVSVNYGAARTFLVDPDSGYHLDSLLVDGVPVDSVTSYTFENVTADHDIDAYFSIDAYTITASAGPGGSITPSGPVAVTPGGSQAFMVTPDPGFYHDTLFVDGVPVDSVTGYTFDGVLADHAIFATFTDQLYVEAGYPVGERWNLVSVPLTVPDYSVAALFPSAIGDAYAYAGGYVGHDTLSNATGYWMKFPAGDTVAMAGFARTSDTVDVDEGWNIVGSISSEIPVTNVSTIPGGLISSGFFAYEGSYTLSPTIAPGRGYWVKLGGAGKLVFAVGAFPSPTAAIRIIPSGELPPPPPEGAGTTGWAGAIPADFTLAQNYPNPFNPSTTVNYTLPEASYVSLRVYNMLGEEVGSLIDGNEAAGSRSARFDATGLPTGVYMVRMVAGRFTATRAMLLLR